MPDIEFKPVSITSGSRYVYKAQIQVFVQSNVDLAKLGSNYDFFLFFIIRPENLRELVLIGGGE